MTVRFLRVSLLSVVAITALLPLTLWPALWTWELLAQGQYDIEARGPWIWAMLLDYFAAIIGAILACAVGFRSAGPGAGRWADVGAVAIGVATLVLSLQSEATDPMMLLLQGTMPVVGERGALVTLLTLGVLSVIAVDRVVRERPGTRTPAPR